MNDAAFIIGNGPSRTPIDLNALSEQEGIIIGCNALYRDFAGFDFLVSIDPQFQAIIESVEEAMGMDERFIFPPEDECWESAEYNPYKRRRSNAGMNAMSEAIKRGYKNIHCLGFDFILADDSAIDNIYEGSDGYGPLTKSNHSDTVHRLAYFEWFARKHNDVNFIFVIPEGKECQIIEASNVTGTFINTFKKKWNC
jgi:hypothetical protein